MDNAEKKQKKTKKPRCSMDGCRKTLSNTLTLITCRCGLNFCSAHRMPECHNCTFDYKKQTEQEKNKCIENMKCVSNKIIKI